MDLCKHFVLLLAFAAAFSSCGGKIERPDNVEVAAQMPPPPPPTPTPTPAVPDLQAELRDASLSETASPIGQFDFKNYTYELPRGWQNPDGTSQLTLIDGKAEPIGIDPGSGTAGDVTPEEKQRRRIGLTHVATKYFDVTGDGEDEAIVILRIETGGSAIPQIVNIFVWKNEKPELIWPFRTGDRADGGLKNIKAENGMLVVELYGQDRYLLGQTETNKITGDEAQLCCPDHFTRTQYKWNGKNFQLQGKRLTYSIDDPAAPPLENHGETMSDPARAKRFLEQRSLSR